MPLTGCQEGAPAIEHIAPKQTLALRQDLSLSVVSPVLAILAGGGDPLILSGSETVEVSRLMDGSRTREEIIAAVSCHTDRQTADSLVAQFQTRGLAVERTPGVKKSDPLVYWHRLGLSPVQTARIGSTRVQLDTPPNHRLGRTLLDAFGQVGIHAVTEFQGPPTGFLVVLTADLHDPRLANARALPDHVAGPWMAILAGGPEPLAVSFGGTATDPCWDCVSFWLRQNRPVDEFLREQTGLAQTSRIDGLEPSLEVLVRHAVLATGKLLADPGQRTCQILAIDPCTLEVSRHGVRARPQCPSCGDPDWMRRQGERAVVLAPTPKGHCEEGGFRRLSPDAAYENFSHLVSPVCGPVSQLGPMPGRNSSTRSVFVSGYRARPRHASVGAESFQRVCAGKGKTASQARASALFEALERFSGMYQGDEAILRASASELGCEAIPPRRLQLFSQHQHEAWTPDHLQRNGALRLARSYAEDSPLDWTPAWSVSRNRRRYIPFAYCFSDLPEHIDRASVCYTGNGVAAGSCLEEAILQGLLELVERDAVAIWWYNRLPRPAVVPKLFSDPWAQRLRTEYDRLGWDLWVLDLTHDLSIPVHAALARSRDEGRFSIGFGCHLEPELAFQRALTELNQIFDPEGVLRAPWDHDAICDDSFLFAHKVDRIDANPWKPGRDFLADLTECTTRLDQVGLELVVVDKSRPDLGVSVAQAIVPGLRHFWPRFGEGRLYSVPVELGWKPAPCREDQLNPVPLLV